MEEKRGYVYLITNKYNTVIYTGITSDLVKRIYEHKNKTYNGFSFHYNVDKVVYYEIFGNMESAILREKQIKAGSRKDKEILINKTNPDWEDLYGEIIG